MAKEKEKKKEEKPKKLTKEDYFKKYGEDEIEIAIGQLMKTGWPKPFHYYRLVYETYKKSIEEPYYWLLNYMRQRAGCAEIIKVTDVFAAAEHSALFGISQQRIGAQQDKISQFLATIGKMVKELFQLVREVRVLKERLSYYRDSYDETSKSRVSAEITLKGTFIDMVEGGAKNPSSVFGMARELQFTILPDLFFSIHPPKKEDIDETVDKLEFNMNVKNVLKRKLRQYMEWKDHTFKELETREKFTIKYLRQHFDIIKLYMAWVRPYLRNLRRMQSEAMEQKKQFSPDIVSAFEGALMEIEILGKFLPEGNNEIYSCYLLHFNYRTRPTMSYVQEGYQRGPIHVGETTISFRAYTWNNEDIQNYIKMREQEDFELIGVVDASVNAAMEALGDELYDYLEEAGKDIERKEEKKEPGKINQPGIADPFVSIFKGFGEIFGIELKKEKVKKESKKDLLKLENEKSKAKSAGKQGLWLHYKNFKKGHRMIQW